MRRLLTVGLVVLLAPVLAAVGWNKAYFGVTQPGSWATTRVTSTMGPPYTRTSTRMADLNGRIVIEQHSEFSDKATLPSTMRYELAKGFDVDRNLIDHLKAVVAASVKSGVEASFSPIPAARISAMKGTPTYAASAVFKGVETVEWRKCDRYSYTRGKKGDAQIETGDLWLNAIVPFGVVKHTTTFTDSAGKVLETREIRLVDSGLEPMTSAPGSKAASALQPMTLKAAYEAGLIKISVEVAPEDKKGDRLKLLIQTLEKPLAITVSTARTSLRVESPVESLVFSAPTDEKFELTRYRPAWIEVNQLGEWRVVGGKIQIMFFEGSPSLVGSATMDMVKK